jgi:hypothetical protein
VTRESSVPAPMIALVRARGGVDSVRVTSRSPGPAIVGCGASG